MNEWDFSVEVQGLTIIVLRIYSLHNFARCIIKQLQLYYCHHEVVTIDLDRL